MNQYTFNEIAMLSGMRLPFYAEWLAAAFGSPQGEDGNNNYGWTATGNSARARTGNRVNTTTGVYDPAAGVKPFAISAYNVVDCVGNVYEWLADYVPRYDAGSGSWAWQDQLSADMGKYYGWKSDGLSALSVGGYWSSGANCGPRMVNLSNTPWNVLTHNGARLACDAA